MHLSLSLWLLLSFLCLVPDEAKSSYQVEGTGYDTYLRDAHRQVSVKRPLICLHFTHFKQSQQHPVTDSN